MNFFASAIIFFLFFLNGNLSFAQKTNNGAIYSGVSWFDDRGEIVRAHGANILKDNGRYYLFGEAHSDTSNAFAGFNCYSSQDLYTWKFESVALPVQLSSKLGANRVGERVKVMRCPETGEYIMFLHADTLTYKDQFVDYATSKNITGPYTFQGALLFNGNPIHKWDMGTFQDTDGLGYVLTHGGDIYKLSDDYKSVVEAVNKNMTSGFEAPTLFRKDSIYYFIGSHLSSWERNDNYYFTATSLKGPWISRGLVAPENKLTWDCQSTFVLPIQGSKETTYLFMGDRWSYPKQASAATYVWQPLSVDGFSISMPNYQDAWSIDTVTGVVSTAKAGDKTIENTDKKFVTFSGKWKHVKYNSFSVYSSYEKDASCSVKFKGTRIGFYALSGSEGGYASVVLRNSLGKTVASCLVDMYCKYSFPSLKFISPILPKDNYNLVVSVTGERGNWTDKKKIIYGSTGYFIPIGNFIIKN